MNGCAIAWHGVEAENAGLRTQVKSDKAIRELIAQIEALEAEKNRLLSRFDEAQARSDEYASTFAEVEAELANLAESLYVASNQLHSTLASARRDSSYQGDARAMVGARSFAILPSSPTTAPVGLPSVPKVCGPTSWVPWLSERARSALHSPRARRQSARILTAPSPVRFPARPHACRFESRIAS